jgi:serine/threonine-protein phosphatase 2A regulatory subunit B
MKPNNMDELNEVITVARFHKSDCNKLLYSTSKGIIKLGDTRASALCDKQAKFYGDRDCDVGKSFFSEIVSSISDTDFDPTGRYIVSRDYLSIKVWDINMDSEPVYKYEINENLKSILCDLYETDSIFDKFDLCMSPNGSTIVTGGYDSQFYLSNLDGSKLCKTWLRSEVPTSINNSDKNKYNDSKAVDAAAPVDISRKVLHCAYHPHEDTLAVTENASLYLYKVAPEW